MYPYTTNPPVATADGLAVAWRAGAQVADLEFYQFHPTAMAVGEHFLVSEAVRGEGAVLLDEHGHRYMKDIDPRAELAPRDVVARENFRVMQAQGGKPVMLDVSPMARENPDLASFLAHRFPTIDAYTRSLGFDWSKSRFRWRPPRTTTWEAFAPIWTPGPPFLACMRPANALVPVSWAPTVLPPTRCSRGSSTDAAPVWPPSRTVTTWSGHPNRS